MRKNRCQGAPIFLRFGFRQGNGGSVIYFIQCGDNGPIKIGLSENVKKRLGALQAANPYQLHLLGVMDGDAAEERMLHVRFGLFRVRGEWYRSHQRLRRFIDTNCRYGYGTGTNWEPGELHNQAQTVTVLWTRTTVGSETILET